MLISLSCSSRHLLHYPSMNWNAIWAARPSHNGDSEEHRWETLSTCPIVERPVTHGTFAGYCCTVLSASILYYCSVEGAPEPMDTSEPVVLLRVNSRKISNTSRHSYIEAVCMLEGGGRASSLLPRPYPLTWRNGLVNQVEFLTTVLCSNDQNILCQTHSKKELILK